MNQLNRRAGGRRKRRGGFGTIVLAAIVIVAVGLAAVMIVKGIKEENDGNGKITEVTPSGDGSSSSLATEPAPTGNVPAFTASAADETRLEKFDMRYELEVDGQIVSSYTADEPFVFGTGDEYTDVEGVISFRGDNFRNGGSYGNIGALNVRYDSEGNPLWGNILDDVWNVPTYSLRKGDGGGYSGSWTGSGWTGQPIIVKWDEQTKQHMNLYDSAKAKENLVEVIYATMDGSIYFLDLETGDPTREKLTLNMPFKGAGSLDPRGIPVLYLGAGDSYDRSSDLRPAKAMAISLIDYTILYEFGTKPDSFALREWTAYDSSALICAENDSLVYPGENGILYVVKLNTDYNKETGELSMSPSRMVKLRYSSQKDREGGFWLGYEGSAAAWQNYVFLTENTGLMHCVDLNTMSVVWAQDILDDTNASPVFSIEDGECYLYVGNTLDTSADSDGKGTVALFKIEASTGKVVWKCEREVYTTSHITGGVMTSPVVGKGNLEGLVFVVYTSYSDYHGSRGDMVAINTSDGTIKWEKRLSTYAWSSPVAVYDSEDNGYIVQCNCGGNVYLVEGTEGETIDRFSIESNIEATPAIYNDMIVIGTRIKGIYGIRIRSEQ